MELLLFFGLFLFGMLVAAGMTVVPIAYMLASMTGRETKRLSGVVGRVFGYGALLALLMTGCGASGTSLNDIQRMRQAERTPQVDIASIISGELAVTGAIQSSSELLNAPETGHESIYYRYVIQERNDDSWRNVESSSNRVNAFEIEDVTGAVRVLPAGARIDAPIKHRRVEGGRRYTEYRLDPGDTVHLMGFATATGDAYTIGFQEQGDYYARISSADASAERFRDNKAGQSRFLMAFGVGCLLIVAFVFFSRFAVHGIAFYLVGATVVVIGIMGMQGLFMLRSDIEQSHRAATHVVNEGERVIQEILQRRDIEADALSLSPLDEPPFAALSEAERQRIRGVRIRMAQAVANAHSTRTQFIDGIVARTMGLPMLPEIELSGDEQERVAMLASVAPATPNPVTAILALVLGGLGMYAGTYWGFRMTKRRRIIENVPPSPTDGVAYGLTELEGTVERIESERPLISPVTKTPCVCYTHVVHHKEDSKSKSDTRTQEGVDFWCRDKSGRIRVASQEAEIYGTQQTQKQIGKETHVETIIVPGEAVYVMGTAQIDRDTHDALVIGPDTTDDAVPFVVSAEPADTLKRRFAMWGAGLLNLGIWATTVAGIWGASMLLPVGPSMYLSIAGLSIAYLFVVMGIIYYNDFVFLKQRVERNESNIEVALQKRYDLIRNIASVGQQYMDHEQSIQEALAELRSVHKANGAQNTEMKAGTTAGKKLLALVEDTPKLQANELVRDLMSALENVDNDIAFMRTGYNDAVERYNMRIRHIPEVLLAKTFRFKALSSWS